MGDTNPTSRFVLFVRVIDNCGHAPQNEWPDAFLQEVIPFLTAP
jgi:pimeloyl-ACP methyl ester carboxylesterase